MTGRSSGTAVRIRGNHRGPEQLWPMWSPTLQMAVDWFSLLSGYGRQMEFWTFIFAGFLKAIACCWLMGSSITRRVTCGLGMGLVSAVLAVRAPVGVFLWVGPSAIATRAGFELTHPVNWVGMLLTSALATAGADALLVRFAFKTWPSRSALFAFLGINAVCLALALYQTAIYIDKHPPCACFSDSTAASPPA